MGRKVTEREKKNMDEKRWVHVFGEGACID